MKANEISPEAEPAIPPPSLSGVEESPLIMRSLQTSLCLGILCLLAGCVGFRFGPGFSMNDKEYFMEPPCVVVRTNAYSLSWRYGDLGFFFQPSSKVVDGQLHFALQATSSSFHLTGRQGE